MLISLNSLYQRDLDKLKQEITSYKNENDLWITKKNISNSAGNLALHICGNLQHFIGATLGNTGYIRNRDYEFGGSGVSNVELIKEIETTKKVVEQVFSTINETDLNNNFPIEVFGHAMTTEYFLLHLLSHLNYHLGQVNYHRRLV